MLRKYCELKINMFRGVKMLRWKEERVDGFFSELRLLVLFVLVVGVLVYAIRDSTVNLIPGELIEGTNFTFVGYEDSIIPNTTDIVVTGEDGSLYRYYMGATDSIKMGSFALKTVNVEGQLKAKLTEIEQEGNGTTSVGDVIFVTEDATLTFGGYSKLGDENMFIVNWQGEPRYFEVGTTLGKTILMKTGTHYYLFKVAGVSIPTNEIKLYFSASQLIEEGN